MSLLPVQQLKNCIHVASLIDDHNLDVSNEALLFDDLMCRTYQARLTAVGTRCGKLATELGAELTEAETTLVPLT